MQPDLDTHLAALAIALGEPQVIDQTLMHLLVQRGCIEGDKVDRFGMLAVLREVVGQAITLKTELFRTKLTGKLDEVTIEKVVDEFAATLRQTLAMIEARYEPAH